MRRIVLVNMYVSKMEELRIRYLKHIADVALITAAVLLSGRHQAPRQYLSAHLVIFVPLADSFLDLQPP